MKAGHFYHTASFRALDEINKFSVDRLFHSEKAEKQPELREGKTNFEKSKQGKEGLSISYDEVFSPQPYPVARF